jgi:NAD(P)-dependent dehydrogenase (short-subunit alcohol dehydrogenase family)
MRSSSSGGAAEQRPERRWDTLVIPAPDLSERGLADLVSLSGRVGVVTGAGRGIGLASARRLAEAGATVVVADLDAVAAEAAAREVGGLPFELDVRDATALERLAATAVADLGRLDVWVNNAGVYPMHEALAMSPEEWDLVLDVDLRAVFLGSREAALKMIELGRGGVIVNVASTAAYRVARPGIAHYAAAKHGVLGLTKSLAVELGPSGVRVLAVAPYVTATPGIEEFAMHAGFPIERVGDELPLGRIAVPDDVARVVLFCASDLAALMTGSTLLVDAGWLAT